MNEEFKKILGKTAPKLEPELGGEGAGVKTPEPASKVGKFTFAKGSGSLDLSLTEEEKEEVRQQAREVVAKKFKKLAKEKFLQQTIKELEIESVPEQQLHPLVIDLAPHANKITVDGRVFVQGQIAYLNQAEYDSINEIMHRTWLHEKEVGGANSSFYKKPTHAILRPGAEVAPLSNLVRV